jgi:hypothetical protein
LPLSCFMWQTTELMVQSTVLNQIPSLRSCETSSIIESIVHTVDSDTCTGLIRRGAAHGMRKNRKNEVSYHEFCKVHSELDN